MAKMLRMSSSMTSTFMPASVLTGTPPAGIGSAPGTSGTAARAATSFSDAGAAIETGGTSPTGAIADGR